MNRSLPDKYTKILPWLHILGAALVAVLTGLFSAVHSPLGQEISAGESPGFAWIGANLSSILGFILAYLVFVCWLQINRMRQSPPSAKILSILVCADVAGIALVALLVFFQQVDFLPLVLTVLLVSLLLQALIGFWRSDLFEADRPSVLSRKYSTNTGLFLVLLFVMGAAISFLDPSWRRLSDQVFLDSDGEYFLRYLFPPVLSGVATVWFGFGMAIIILGLRWLQVRISDRQGVYRFFNFLTFFSLVGAFTAFLLVTLYYAIPWQINHLNLRPTVCQLFLFLSTAGGILFSAVFYKIVPHMPESQAMECDWGRCTDPGGNVYTPGHLVFVVLAQKK